jgi:hypothetical protein
MRKALETSVEEIPGFEVLVCPVCGFHYLHPLRVKVATGVDLTVVDSKGVQVVRGDSSPESKAADAERGVRIILEYFCEQGHHGEIVFQFHEGNVFVEHRPLPPLGEWSVIWRD